MRVKNHILALSFDSIAAPRIFPKPLNTEGEEIRVSHGWGITWYPLDGHAAAINKNTIAMESMNRSTTFLSFLEEYHLDAPLTDIQPFVKVYGGRDWIWCSHPHLIASQRYEYNLKTIFKPVGSTLSELSFCYFLQLLDADGYSSLGEVAIEELAKIVAKVRTAYNANFIVTNGSTLLVYRSSKPETPLYLYRVFHPYAEVQYSNEAFTVGITDPLDNSKTMLAISSMAMSDDNWQPLGLNQLYIIRKGQCVNQIPITQAILKEVNREKVNDSENEEEEMLQQSTHPLPEIFTTKLHYQLHPKFERSKSLGKEPRRLSVYHKTSYYYEKMVEYSEHTIRLCPQMSEDQRLIKYSFKVSQESDYLHYEDVFGNEAVHFTLKQPYKQLEIISESIVERLPSRVDFSKPLRQISIPLFWTPWQRQMMNPYLLPIELPESELKELSDYAMSFVERNYYDLLETVFNINNTIYHDYCYVSGSTNLRTTPYEVYSARRGVCQDFANLFICLARLLNIPARYRVGYIYTGGDYENKIQSDASHAWVELYLPYIGWVGFDPTNGVLTNEDHVRIACGRNYLDATPTSGVIYKGGGWERLHVDVKVREIPLEKKNPI